MTQHFIQSNKLYILSGPSASGKSSFTRQLINQGLPEDAIVSTDSIRKQILGTIYGVDEYGIKEILNGWELNQNEIFNIINNILDIRLKQKLTTVLDETNLSDLQRKPYVDLAKQHGMESSIIIFDLPKDELKLRLSKRKERFNFSVVEKQLNNFQKDSIYPYISVTEQDNFNLIPNLINTTKLHVIGDTHGLLSELILLLNKNNWYLEDNTFINSDKEQKILFLGDILDRGLESIALLKIIENTVRANNGFFLLGNHEAKLISSYEQYLKEGIVRGKSLSSSQTLIEFLSLDVTEQEHLYKFLKNSPTYYCLWINKDTLLSTNDTSDKNILKIAFCHADNEYFHPYKITFSHALYGKRTMDKHVDIDLEYEKNFKIKLNEHILFRGHIPNFSKQDNVYSLEDSQAFAGNLVSLDISQYLNYLQKNNWESKHQFFEDSIMKEKSEFNYDEKIKSSVEFIKQLEHVYKEGLVSDGWKKDENGKKNPHPDGFKIYKYSKKVHFKRLWKTHPVLEKARGIALDIAGNIIVHPFDKLYNYGEYDVGSNMLPEQKVQVVEKLNGFLGCISKHPFKKELLFSTTGSFTSDFTQYIKDFVDPKTEANILHYFSKNKQTLMFEVIHPEDKHIIDYKEKDQGLWLIGARGLNINDKILTEIELDSIAKTLDFKRPFWYETTFKNVLESLQNSELEGFMIRNSENHEPIMKIKSNYYLVTKFIGRLGPKLTEEMFKNPEKFKETKVEEEFYPIVDNIIQKISQKDFSDMEPKSKMDFVRNIVNEVRNNFVNPLKNKNLKFKT